MFLMGMMAPAANATLMLSVSDGGTPINYTDNGAGDLVPLNGMLTATPSFPTNFIGNTITGASKPLIGGNTIGRLDLNSINISVGPGTLTIMLTDTDFMVANGLYRILTEIGGTLDGSISVNTYVDDANIAFATTTLVSTITSSDSFFSAGTNSFANLSGMFSITHVVTLTHTGPGQISSFDLSTTVPEPNGLALIGLGILLLGGYFKGSRQYREISSPAC